MSLDDARSICGRCGRFRHNWVQGQHRALTTYVGEFTMPRKAMTFQFDLLASPHGSGIAQTPRWLTLPSPTRQTLTPLIVRRLLAHADGGPVAELQEMRDDL